MTVLDVLFGRDEGFDVLVVDVEGGGGCFGICFAEAESAVEVDGDEEVFLDFVVHLEFLCCVRKHEKNTNFLVFGKILSDF